MPEKRPQGFKKKKTKCGLNIFNISSADDSIYLMEQIADYTKQRHQTALKIKLASPSV